MYQKKYRCIKKNTLDVSFFVHWGCNLRENMYIDIMYPIDKRDFFLRQRPYAGKPTPTWKKIYTISEPYPTCLGDYGGLLLVGTDSRIYSFDGSAWAVLHDFITGDIQALVAHLDGRLYALHTTGSAKRVFRYDGFGWNEIHNSAGAWSGNTIGEYGGDLYFAAWGEGIWKYDTLVHAEYNPVGYRPIAMRAEFGSGDLVVVGHEIEGALTKGAYCSYDGVAWSPVSRKAGEQVTSINSICYYSEISPYQFIGCETPNRIYRDEINIEYVVGFSLDVLELHDNRIFAGAQSGEILEKGDPLGAWQESLITGDIIFDLHSFGGDLYAAIGKIGGGGEIWRRR